jgi:hypothetical protein
MRKKDIRQDMAGMPPAASSDQAAVAPASDVAQTEDLKPEILKSEPLTTHEPKLEVAQVEAAQTDLSQAEETRSDAPKAETSAAVPEFAKSDPTPIHALKNAARDQRGFDPSKPEAVRFDATQSTASAEAARPRTNRFPLLAASVALAAAFGAVLGSLAPAGVAKLSAPKPAAAIPAATAASTFIPATAPTKPVAVVDPQWKETIARVRSDIAALKAEVEASNRAISAHFSKIGDRLDRTERAQSEPGTKLARIIETLDRIELRTAAAAGSPSAAPDTTGTVPGEARQPLKGPIVDGWVLRQVFDGFALIEGLNGRLFEVGPGSNIPGVGRVETIRRQEGQWVVVTPKGMITR